MSRDFVARGAGGSISTSPRLRTSGRRGLSHRTPLAERAASSSGSAGRTVDISCFSKGRPPATEHLSRDIPRLRHPAAVVGASLFVKNPRFLEDRSSVGRRSCRSGLPRAAGNETGPAHSERGTKRKIILDLLRRRRSRSSAASGTRGAREIVVWAGRAKPHAEWFRRHCSRLGFARLAKVGGGWGGFLFLRGVLVGGCGGGAARAGADRGSTPGRDSMRRCGGGTGRTRNSLPDRGGGSQATATELRGSEAAARPAIR